MTISRSGRRLLERLGIEPTYRGPVSVVAPRSHAAHNYPLAPPLPYPEFQLRLEGNPPPDRNVSQIWPNNRPEEGSYE